MVIRTTAPLPPEVYSLMPDLAKLMTHFADMLPPGDDGAAAPPSPTPAEEAR